MAPWPPWVPSQITKGIRKAEQPDYRGLSFYQALGLRRKAKVAKELEFSRILSEVADEFAKRPRVPLPWDRQEKIVATAPVAHISKKNVKDLADELEMSLMSLEGSSPIGSEGVARFEGSSPITSEGAAGKRPMSAMSPVSKSASPDTVDGSPSVSVSELCLPPQSHGHDLLDALNMRSLSVLWDAMKARGLFNGADQANRAVVEKITQNDFLQLCEQHVSEDPGMLRLLESVFSRVNQGRNASGHVRIHDVTTALVLISTDDPDSKLLALFKIFDVDDDGCVTLDEIFDLFLSVKVNDLTRREAEAMADQTFNGELSLQAAKRLFQLTAPHFSVDTDTVVFDDFQKAVRACPEVLPNLLPGFASLESMQISYEAQGQFIRPRSPLRRQASKRREAAGDFSSFGREVKNKFIGTLRRGEEDLDISTRPGRAERLMRQAMNVDTTSNDDVGEQCVRKPSRRPSRRLSIFSQSRHSAAVQRHVSALHKNNNEPAGGAASGIRIANERSLGRKSVAARQARVEKVRPDEKAGAETQQMPKQETSNKHLSGDGRVVIDVSACAQPGETLEEVDQAIDYGAAVSFVAPDIDEDDGVESPTASLKAQVHTRSWRTPISYDMHEATAVIDLPAHEGRARLSGKNSKRFRQVHMDQKTEQQYRLDCARDAVKGQRTYTCSMCSLKHSLKIGRPDAQERRALLRR